LFGTLFSKSDGHSWNRSCEVVLCHACCLPHEHLPSPLSGLPRVLLALRLLVAFVSLQMAISLPFFCFLLPRHVEALQAVIFPRAFCCPPFCNILAPNICDHHCSPSRLWPFRRPLKWKCAPLCQLGARCGNLSGPLPGFCPPPSASFNLLGQSKYSPPNQFAGCGCFFFRLPFWSLRVFL